MSDPVGCDGNDHDTLRLRPSPFPLMWSPLVQGQVPRRRLLHGVRSPTSCKREIYQSPDPVLIGVLRLGPATRPIRLCAGIALEPREMLEQAIRRLATFRRKIRRPWAGFRIA